MRVNDSNMVTQLVIQGDAIYTFAIPQDPDVVASFVEGRYASAEAVTPGFQEIRRQYYIDNPDKLIE